MSKKIHTAEAPAAIGPYSQGMVTGNLVFTSGQIALDPTSGQLVGTTVEEQTHQVCRNLSAILTAAGTSLEHTVKTVCYLSDMADFAAFNEVYATYFVGRPARSCVAVKTLPKHALVEVEVIANLAE